MDLYLSLEDNFPSPPVWDNFVSRAPDGHLLQSWAWGELKGEFGWRPVRVAVRDGDHWIAGAQILFRPLPFSRCIAYVPRGPCLMQRDPEVTRALLEGIHHVAQQSGAIFLKLEPNWEEKEETHTWLRDQGFIPSAQTIQPRRTILLDLTADKEAILAQMKSKTRYNIRLAERKGVQVRQGTEADIPLFHQLMVITGKRDRFGVHSEAYYRAVWRHLSAQGRAVLLLASYRGEVLAGLFAAAFGTTAIYMYGASSNRHRNRMPNHRLQWEAICWAKRQGCRHYDFWGIPDLDPNSATATLTGVHRFKRGFGGCIVRYVGAYDYVYSRPLYRLWTQAWSLRTVRQIPIT